MRTESRVHTDMAKTWWPGIEPRCQKGTWPQTGISPILSWESTGCPVEVTWEYMATTIPNLAGAQVQPKRWCTGGQRYVPIILIHTKRMFPLHRRLKAYYPSALVCLQDEVFNSQVIALRNTILAS